MDYTQRCFYTASNWNDENSYESILATSKNLLNFKIPDRFKLNISSKNTEYSYSSVTLSQLNKLSGSLAYMYCSADLKDEYQSSKNLQLQSVLQGYRLIQPSSSSSLLKTNQRPILLYGKMYFPSQFLEAMIIKRISLNSQLILKFINTPKLNKLQNSTSIMTLYYQKQNEKSSQDFIFCTNEALFGFRNLYNIGNNSNSDDSSLLSIGFELWYASKSMSPGISTALRYSTHLSSSGKPLTMTLAINPLLGSIESTYAIKTDLSSTFISKYDFNIYSYESDLTLGFDIWRYASDSKPNHNHNQREKVTGGKHQFVNTSIPLKNKNSRNFNNLDELEQEEIVNSFMQVKPNKLIIENNSKNFINDLNSANFTSSLKCFTSLKKNELGLLWEGKFKDWLLTTGLKINYKDNNSIGPKLYGYGLELQYSS
ncbi:hypothetical protein CANARDRAFT_9425 [[Candida] arabinofermentans NRRL YB-2248]|uniref:Mitochondrial distribution and morphology protein 10 n=1 Tax=[Candida] arabinofermentans NRRL YB-2248 TaxID=983967 RepID=A0A1E4SVS1_9ASCO|nr:hypothetical protein CANARDRAFT_9425 [[Candida] arabinofermentans NRRL YB-2248]